MRRWVGVVAPAMAALALGLASPARASDALPTVEVPTRTVHMVPSDADTANAPAVTIQSRDGRTRTIENTAELVPPRAPAPPYEAPALLIVSGRAVPTGGATLTVDGRAIHLFGVAPSVPRDRCGLPSGSVGSCSEAARALLAARLQTNAAVTCTLPDGQTRDPGYQCRDAHGVDLGALLVSSGVALIDRASSFQYLGDQDRAHRARLGLWRMR